MFWSDTERVPEGRLLPRDSNSVHGSRPTPVDLPRGKASHVLKSRRRERGSREKVRPWRTVDRRIA